MPHPPQGPPPPRPGEVAHTEHFEETFTTSELIGWATGIILIPLLLWGLKLAITRTLTQGDVAAKKVSDRLTKLEEVTADHALELAKRPDFDQLSHAKTELRDEFRSR